MDHVEILQDIAEQIIRRIKASPWKFYSHGHLLEEFTERNQVDEFEFVLRKLLIHEIIENTWTGYKIGPGCASFKSFSDIQEPLPARFRILNNSGNAPTAVPKEKQIKQRPTIWTISNVTFTILTGVLIGLILIYWPKIEAWLFSLF